MTNQPPTPDIHSVVRERYGSIARQFQPGAQAKCGCGDSASASSCCAPKEDAAELQLSSVEALYEAPDAANLPADVTGLSLGCGDPVTLASLKPGETVLDLGSGGGIDCFLAAKRVGASGHVIGVDMTAEMIEKARANKTKLNAENVEFRLGEIEHLPVADNTVDVILSNCVVNLSPDKAQVFREAYRVLKPGGRLSVSDIVTAGPLPEAVKNSLSAWAGCVAGALEASEYIAAIEAAGFTSVQLTPVYMDKATIDAAAAQLGDAIDLGGVAQEDLYTAVFSAKITANKPA